jgi:hypothetical protein
MRPACDFGQDLAWFSQDGDPGTAAGCSARSRTLTEDEAAILTNQKI